MGSVLSMTLDPRTLTTGRAALSACRSCGNATGTRTRSVSRRATNVHSHQIGPDHNSLHDVEVIRTPL